MFGASPAGSGQTNRRVDRRVARGPLATERHEPVAVEKLGIAGIGEVADPHGRQPRAPNQVLGQSMTTLEQATVSNGVASFPANATPRFYTLATGKVLSASSGSLAGSATFNVVSGDLVFADGFESCRL